MVFLHNWAQLWVFFHGNLRAAHPMPTPPWVVWWPLHFCQKHIPYLVRIRILHLTAGTYKRKVIFHFHVSFRGDKSFLHTLCQTRTQKLWPRKAKHCWGQTWKNLPAASTTQNWNETTKYFPIDMRSKASTKKITVCLIIFLQINFKQTKKDFEWDPYLYRYIQNVMVLNPSKSAYVG